MSDATDSPQLGLDAVSEPATPPPTVPDAKTREERDSERQESRLKKLASSAAFRSVVLSERENERLGKELDDANRERRDLHDLVRDLGPRNALLNQAMHDMRGNFTIAALLLTGGSTSVSIAGAISDPFWKRITLYSGVTASVIGLLLTLYTFIWINPRRRD